MSREVYPTLHDWKTNIFNYFEINLFDFEGIPVDSRGNSNESGDEQNEASETPAKRF
jgi:hypothetical protein